MPLSSLPWKLYPTWTKIHNDTDEVITFIQTQAIVLGVHKLNEIAVAEIR